MYKDITVILVTSVLPSHPDTHIIEETINSIRQHLPDCEIIMQIDGLRAEQEDRREDYEEYKTRILWLCLHKYKNILPIIFDKYSHQSTMMAKTLQYIQTPLILYVEGDCPLVTDQEIDWQKCIDFIISGEANTIRFHHEAVIPEDHKHLMLGDKDGFMRTHQWSQRPHLTTLLYYKDIVLPAVPKRTFIEDYFHGIVNEDYLIYGNIGWNKHRLWIYYSNDKNIKRSYTTDGRQGGLKYTSDDDV